MRRMCALLAAITLVLSGCHGVITDPNAGTISNISVGADAAGVPTIDYPDGLTYSKEQTRVVWPGTGAHLQPGDRILLDMYAVSLQSGAVITDTYNGLPKAYILAPELLGQELYDILASAKVGERFLHVTPPLAGYQAQGAVALVVDVLPARATGTVMPDRTDLPSVDVAPNGEPTITIAADDVAPTDLVSATLIEGAGEQIRAGSHIEVTYVGVSYPDGAIFQSSWGDGEGPMTAQIGIGEVPAGWDQGLLDHTEGSRVMLLIPPALAYGDKALCFVIDILAVWNQE